MDGRIWAESEVGKGSTFHVILQVYREQDMQPQTPIVEAPSHGGDPVGIELAVPVEARDQGAASLPDAGIAGRLHEGGDIHFERRFFEAGNASW